MGLSYNREAQLQTSLDHYLLASGAAIAVDLQPMPQKQHEPPINTCTVTIFRPDMNLDVAST